LRRDGRVEHATQGNTIDIARMNAKTDDTPRELIHDHRHPVALQ